MKLGRPPITQEEFEIKFYNNTNGFSIIGNYINSRTDIKIRHSCGYPFDVNAGHARRGEISCPVCDDNSKLINTEVFKIKMSRKFGDEFEVIGNYNGMDKPIEVIHKKCGKPMNKPAYYYLYSKYGCIDCAFQSMRYSHEDFIVLMNEINPNIEILGNYYNSTTNISVRCKICGHKWDPEPKTILSGEGCGVCSNNILEEDINDIPTTAPWMIPYFQGGIEEAKQYQKSSNKKIHPKCPLCGRIKNDLVSVNTIYYHQSIGCICGDGKSYPEKYVESLLKQLNIKYFTQYSTAKGCSWCDNYRYDFYLIDYNIIIEVHGEQHYKYAEVIQNDINKYNLAITNVSNYIIIDASKSNSEFIKNNILNSDLKKYIDLTNVNWNKCEKESLFSLVVEICSNWCQETSNIKDLSEKYNLHSNTIYRYLEKGNNLGLCNFDKDEYVNRIKSIGHKIGGSKLGKKVKCIETGIIYNSTADANEALGKSRTSHTIARAARGIIKTAFGYHWEYI